ncbi:MAG TPA: protein kinase, partial [Thermoanaerobaculia bacterium]|nr:protein kinase [Thermoanaerobaculia bacterium]
MLEDRRPLVSTDPGLLTCYRCHGTYSKASPSCPHCSASHVGESGIGPGSVIDRKYEILSLLGVGGMGEVFKARHVRLETFRTIKVMRKSFIADETFRGRFLREARLATQVHHPNVALVHDFATLEDGTYYMVSEFISGVTIRQWLNKTGRFTLPMTVDVALQVLAGLDAIHAQGMLHRDISAENVMISTTADDRPMAKIIDLGIAKTLAAPSTEMTSAGMFIGNPRYSSPEQLGDLPAGQRLDGRADLYCLAVVIYEMVAGVSPFGSDTTRGYMIKHLTQPPTPFAETIPGEIPQEFEDVVFKALEKKRTNRWATARDFAYALRPFLNTADRVTSSWRIPDLRPPQSSMEVTEVGRRSFSDALIHDREDWQHACAENTLEAYRGYLRKHEGGRFGTDAVKKIQEISLLSEIRRREEEDDVRELELLSDSFDPDSSLRHAVDSAIERVRERISIRARQQEQASWSSASERDVIPAYEDYLSHYPGGEWAEQAKERIRQLHIYKQIPLLEARQDVRGLEAIARSETGNSELAAAVSDARARVHQALERKKQEADERDWQKALAGDSIDSFGSYLNSQPEGQYRDKARNQLRDLTAIREIIELEKADILEPILDIARTDASQRVRDAATAAAERLHRNHEAQRSHEENKIWTEALQSGTAAAWKRHLERYPDSLRRSEAEQFYREAVAFESAVAAETSVAVDEFLGAFQDGVHRAEAASLRDARRTAEAERAYRKAFAEGSTVAYRTFLENHAASSREEEVRRLLEESESFERALADPLPARWKEHLQQWSAGRLAAKARGELAAAEELRDREFSKALRDRDSDGLESFLGKYPEERTNEKVSAALKARKQQAEYVREENRLWEEAVRDGTAAAWKKYLNKFADSPRIRDAKEA